MTLLSTLIRKRDTKQLATATPAIAATQQEPASGTVAKIASVAVAKRITGKTAHDLPSTVAITAVADRSMFHFAEGEQRTVSITPAVNHATAAEAQANRPQQIATETEATEIMALIMAVFSGISEVDRNEALAVALADPGPALRCYRVFAEERGIGLVATDDDRRHCSQCLNLRGRACTIAKPERGALVVANRGYRPAPDTLQRCAGYLPNTTDDDQRTGRERWPGL